MKNKNAFTIFTILILITVSAGCIESAQSSDGNGIIYRCQINGSIGNDCRPIDCKNWNLR